MRSKCIIAAAALAASAGMAFGQGGIQLDIAELTTPANLPLAAATVNQGPVVIDATGATEVSVTLWVRAQITGDTTATGLTTFDGRLSDGGDGGAFNHAVLLTYEVTPGLPNFPGATDTPDFSGRRGMLPDYRATIGNNNADPGNGADDGGDWTFLPLSISATGAGGIVMTPVYKFTWTSMDTSARTVTLTVGAAGGGYQSPTGLVTTANIGADSFVIEIIPAPGAMALMGLGGLVAMRRRR